MPTCMASVGMAIVETPLMRTHVHVYKHGVVIYTWELRGENRELRDGQPTHKLVVIPDGNHS